MSSRSPRVLRKAFPAYTVAIRKRKGGGGLSKRSASAILRRMARLYFSKRVSRSAAAMSFFLLLTVFPLLICLNGMLGSLFPSTERFEAFARGLMPAETLSAVADYLRYIGAGAGRGMLTAGLLMTCTTAAAVFRATLGVMADLHGRPRYRGLLSWPLSFLYSLAFLAVMYFAALVVLLGERLLTVLAGQFAFIDPDSLWTALRYPLLFLLVYLMLWGLYRVTAPPEKGGGFAVGALAAAAGIELLSAAFSAFIGMSSRYALVYGSLTSLVMLMLWLYFCCTLVILGNALNLCLAGWREE